MLELLNKDLLVDSESKVFQSILRLFYLFKYCCEGKKGEKVT